MIRHIPVVFVLLAALALPALAEDEVHSIVSFDKQRLTGDYYAEGANFGDLNNDGHMDIVYGPLWFEGPDFKKKHLYYDGKAFPINQYTNNFFAYVYDFNGNGWNDILILPFPGTASYWYENPGKDKVTQPGFWKRHLTIPYVGNESPTFIDITGDGKPEIVCSVDEHYGYATPDPTDPTKPWVFHRITDRTAGPRFVHGLGVGDVDGDGRMDLIDRRGWWRQPESLEGDPQWKFHPFTFTPAGGSQMFVYDVDGDGNNDIITSMAAHSWGLAWYEHIKDPEAPGGITFKQHTIMSFRGEPNEYGVKFSQLHALDLVDVDGDGLKDIVTGKTYWAHHGRDPGANDGAVVYWFKLVREKDQGQEADQGPGHVTKSGVRVKWLPMQADDDSGVGRQVVVGDVNGDGMPDIVTGNTKGAHVLFQRRQRVTRAVYESALPKPPVPQAAGLTPQEAAKQMTARPGFVVDLVAGEPTVHQPVAFTIDHRGRIWIAEAHTYPTRAPGAKPVGDGKDKIIILEDTNGDGQFDSRKTFIDGLNLVSGMEVGFGGVWVGAAPYLLFIPIDESGDKPGGEPIVLLDGFGYQDTHETLNAFIWGPDGWLYGCHGVFTHSRVGKPGTPDADRTPMNAAVWRYHPTKHQFEVFAWGTSNPWGVDFDDHGQAFATACVIPHLFHIVQGARYHRQGGRHFNPHVYDDIKTIADHHHYAGAIQDHAWWGRDEAVHDHTTDAAGGGHAHCGAMIYLGGAFPPEYRNAIFMNNIHGNRVNMDILEPHGSGYIGRHGPDFVKANDQWFRGINLKYGPDGAVYLIDWYDKNACHRGNADIWDRTNGRVFRVSYGEHKPVKVDLSKQSTSELIQLQTHRNDWYVRTARRLLQERMAAKQRPVGPVTPKAAEQDELRLHLRILALEATEAEKQGQGHGRRLRAMWAAHVMGLLDGSQLAAHMTDEDEFVRAWAIQLALENKQPDSLVLHGLNQVAKSDQSPVVRKYLASALQRLPLEHRWAIAEALVQHNEDIDDHNLPLLYWYGIEPLVPADTNRAMKLAASSKIPLITRYIVRRAAADAKGLDAVVAALDAAGNDDARLLVLDEMLSAFQGRVGIPMPQSWQAAYGTLTKSESAAVRDRADQIAVAFGDKRIFPRMRTVLADANAPLAERRKAMTILTAGRDADSAKVYQAVLAEPALRGDAIKALAGLADPGTPAAILTHYASFNDEHKRDAVNTLTSRPPYAMALLDAIEQAKVPGKDLHAYNVRQLLAFNDPKLTGRIEKVWGAVAETSADKQAEIDRYKTMLTPAKLSSANLSNGRRLYEKTCASCHKLFGEGGEIGPDITGSNRANLDYMLENLIAPSAVIGKDYQLTVIDTADGRLVQGLVQQETDSAVTLRTINDTVVIPKADILSRDVVPQSMMPEALIQPLSEQETADLIAYLASPTQVAISGPRAPIAAATGKVPGAIEGEAMKVLSRTRGNSGPQNMAAFPKDKWSGASQLWWTGGQPGDKLTLELPVERPGNYELELVLTRARDYAVVQLYLNDQKLGGPIDLFNSPDVITTGVLSFGPMTLDRGPHKLTAEIVGANPQAIKAYMFALDYVRLQAK